MTKVISGHVTTVLGAEHDRQLWNAVMQILRDLGATKVEESWGVVGSQELQRIEVMLGNDLVVVEGETYMGLSIIATPEIVSQITARLRDLLPRSAPP